MKRIHTIALAASFLLLAGGCAGSRRAESASVTARPDEERVPGDSAAATPKTDAASPYLERHGFSLLSFRAVRDNYEQVCVVGEIRNIGSASRGVELQVSLRDADGRIVAVGHFVPASHRNIVPEETWPFTYSFGRQEDAVEAELRIVGAFRTMDILNVASSMP